MRDDLGIIVQSIDYIEGHLDEKLSVEQISEAAGFSRYHFTRIFTKAVGMSPYDYYRGRKVTETIRYLRNTGCKIIDAALTYGFSSPEVFVRACKGVFGMSPSQIRKEVEMGTFEGIEPVDEAWLRMSEGYDFRPEVRFLPELSLSGIGYTSEERWSTLRDIELDKIKQIIGEAVNAYKISWTEMGPMGYMNFIGAKHSDGEKDNELLVVKQLPRMSYLEFLIDETIQEAVHFMDYIYDVFMPASEYEPAAPFTVERLDVVKGASHLYVPVVPKV